MLGATTLVLKTIRKGFPTAEIFVHGNGLRLAHAAVVAAETAAVGGVFSPLPEPMQHDAWIERLVETMAEPFWIVDTDVVFFGAVEGWKFRRSFAGEFQSEFFCEHTGMIHRERLHTAVMWMDPVRLRSEMLEWGGQLGKIPFVLAMPWIRQTIQPMRVGNRRKIYFYDSTAGLHHAIGGQAFTDAQVQTFEHLHCGTYSDLVTELQPLHQAVVGSPEMAEGIRARQREYFQRFKTRS